MADRVAEPARPEAGRGARSLLRRRRGGGPAATPVAGPPLVRLRPGRGPGAPGPDAPAPVAQAIRSPGSGRPLPESVRGRLEESFGADLGEVRVHTDPAASAAAGALSARAFAHGPDVFLAGDERPTDVRLMAHEVAHVIQQQAAPSPMPFTPGGAGLEREAEQSATAVAQGEPATVPGRTGESRVQGLFGFGDWIEGKMWSALEEFAPVLVPIIRKGFFTWLTEKISAAVDGLFETLMGPVKAVTGIFESLTGHFANLVAWVREAAAKIARGDCSSITEAAQKISDVISGLATPIVEQVQEWAATVKGYFTDIWERFGAPAWEFLKKVGGEIWDTIKDLATWIWDKTKPIRDWVGRAWTWIKDKLGIGEGPEGQNGILQWVQGKASAAWDWVKAKVEPYKKQILVVAAVVVGITGAPIFAIAAVVGGLIYGIRWIAQHLRTSGSVVDQRGVLEREVIPKIMSAVGGVSSKLAQIAAFLTEKLGAIVGGLGKVAGQLAGSILSFLVGAVQWISGKFKALLAWATEKVAAVAEWVKSALEKLKAFLEPVLDLVRWIGSVVRDIFNLVTGVVKRIWAKIPACIKDPVVSFIVNQVLKRIPIFNKLVEVKNIWEKVKDGGLRLIRNIFVKWDLHAAIMSFFDLVLTILEIPLDLVKSIYAKARSAFDEIVKDPLGFLRNALKAAWEGFGMFFDRIGTHLWNGVVGWFRGEMKKAGVEIPTELTFKSILGLVLSVAGITVDKVFSILEKKLHNKPLADKIRKYYRYLTGVWEWVTVAIERGATGLWEKIKETAGSLWDLLMDTLVGWVTKQVVMLASPRLLAALNPVGAIINAILAAWAAIQTAAAYARQILEIVNTVLDTALDLAKGATARAAGFVEKALAAALPMAIGFLANFLRINLADRVKSLLEPIQLRVETAIGTIIDKALQYGRPILERLGASGPAGETATFGEGSETHTISAEGEPGREQIYVASATRKTATEHLASWEANDLPALPRQSDQTLGRKAITAARSWLTKRGKQSETKLDELIDPFKKLFQLFGHPTVVETVVTPSSGASEKSVLAQPLTLKLPTKGAAPSRGTDAHTTSNARLRQLNLVPGLAWVKLHILHFDLGGPDAVWNLAPGTNNVNQQMLHGSESPAIKELQADPLGKKVMWYESKVKLFTGADSDFASAIDVDWGPFDVATGKRTTKSHAHYGPLHVPGTGVTTAVLSTDTDRDLNLVGGFPWSYATAVADAQSSRKFKDVPDILARVAKARTTFTDFTGLQAALDAGIAAGRLTIK